MANIDSIFKSRDITLPTKVHLVKAMVFPVTRAAGMNTHLPKPVDADKLYSTLKAAIGRRESERRS